MKITHYGEKDFKTSNWSGGTTTELFIYPREADYQKRNFLFRLSSATVDLDRSDFTPLPGFFRFISPLNGDLKISHDEKNFTKLKPYEVYAFEGGAKTVSMGRVRDFNLMVKEGIQTEVKNFALNKNSVLKFSISKGEIGWIFSYNAKLPLTAETAGGKNKFNLDKLDLIIFEPDSDIKEEVLISTDGTISLFYGKIPVVS
ncbi:MULTISPECIES: HutD family protein [unclassified Treponema]|uniref:HutD family protein n=1 Tax=unclassified Treponema TaxID=2638727 RepID=UPI0020A4A4C3|nr:MULTISPECIES: HutD family protein [unclassified Treponema]UTC66351.1 HutD family protein [Treponema sp. OMZ 789]UTC69081.1 HutD family protein [Treponema sp. OMZ 790]UTC71793.1 HutD family protein [Treponema sp. OMZ 791]